MTPPAGPAVRMPKDKRPTREDMLKAEKEVGENIPEAFVGMDDGDVRDVTRHEENEDEEKAETRDPPSRH